jgi:hypothetical protein
MSNTATWVQFYRNLFCVVNSLLPVSSFLKQPVFPFSNISFIKETTYMEYAIALTQIHAVIHLITIGYINLAIGYSNYKRYSSFNHILDKLAVHGGTSGSAEYTILQHGIRRDIKESCDKSIGGIFELIMGISFFFLAANSLHLKATSHPKPLFDALICMEICLLFFLYLMIISFVKNMNYSTYTKRLYNIMESKNSKLGNFNLICIATEIGFEENFFDAFTIAIEDFSPIYKANTDAIESLKADLHSINEIMNAKAIVSTTATMNEKVNIPKLKKLQKLSSKYYYSAMYDLVLLILNFVAFYGYLMSILVFYFPDTTTTNPIINHEFDNATTNMFVNETSSLLSNLTKQSEYFSPLKTVAPNKHFIKNGEILDFIRVILLNLSHPNADWFGGFAGDLAWTIEPMVVMLFPFVLKHLMKVLLLFIFLLLFF